MSNPKTAAPVGRPGTGRPWPSRSTLSGVLVGIGVAGFVDETVFHQLLHWHSFYDRSTPTVGLVSDGWFHAGSWAAMVTGLFLFADLQRRHATHRRRLWSGALLGFGGFQTYDGLVQHKVMSLHQIRYGVEIWPYDLAWNVAGGLALVVGLVLLRNGAKESQ